MLDARKSQRLGPQQAGNAFRATARRTGRYPDVANAGRSLCLLNRLSIIVSRSHRTMTAYVGLFLYIGHFLDTTPGSTT